MSEVVEGLDLRDVSRAGRPPKYDWDLWFDGRVHRLVAGEDYEADSVRGFRSTVYSAAKRYGLVVKALVIDGDLHVQAIYDEQQGDESGEEDERRTSRRVVRARAQPRS